MNTSLLVVVVAGIAGFLLRYFVPFFSPELDGYNRNTAFLTSLRSISNRRWGSRKWSARSPAVKRG